MNWQDNSSHNLYNVRGWRGFTLTEMLVVVAIIAALMGLLLPALSSVKQEGYRVRECAAARSLMLAYASYAHDNYDAVLPGYMGGLTAEDFNGRDLVDVNPVTAKRYPWRIAPYLDHALRSIYVNQQQRLYDRFLEREAEEGDDLFVYFVSLSPSFGYNTWWVGGDEQHLALESYYGRFYVKTMGEVRRPDRLLAFASARGLDPLDLDGGTAASEGYFQVTSPRLGASQGLLWADVYHAGTAPGDYGFVSPRYRSEAVVAMIDGHVEMLDDRKLKDMRYWANRAKAFDWGLSAVAQTP